MTALVAIRASLFTLGILSFAAHWFMPQWTRPDLYFAVTVSPTFPTSAEGLEVLQRYRRSLLVVAMPTLGAWIPSVLLSRGLYWEPLILLLQVGACLVVFYRARGLVLRHASPPTTIREAKIGRHRRVPGGSLAAAGPFILLAACACYLATHWSLIPAHMVLRWAADGRPARWVARTPLNVFSPLLIGLLALLAMSLFLFGVSHWLRPIDVSGRRGRQESRYRLAASTGLLLLEYWVSFVVAWVAARPTLPHMFQRIPVGLSLVPAMIALGTTLILLWLRQGERRMHKESSPAADLAAPIGDRIEDRYWRLGVFYSNPNDPSVLVEKRFGIGYTLNFAHPIAWVIAIMPLLAFIVLAIAFKAW